MVWKHQASYEKALAVQKLFVKSKEAQLNEGDRYWRQATTQEDKSQHWDELFEIAGKYVCYEVKGKKKLGREKNEEPQDVYVCLELRGRDCGGHNHGWIFGGQSEFIAFERDHDFVVVDRLHLVEFLKKRMKITGARDPKLETHKTFRQPLTNPDMAQIYWRHDDKHGRFMWLDMNELIDMVPETTILPKKAD